MEQGHWIYMVYSNNPKNGQRNPLKYFSDQHDAYAYLMIVDHELRACGRYAFVKPIWVTD